jgi:hypothetical protein
MMEVEMRIDHDTQNKMGEATAEHGESVATLTGIGRTLAEQPLFQIDRGLMGSKGEVFTRDRYISFKSDKAFRKAKEIRTVDYSGIADVAFDGAASWLRWTFAGSGGRFELELLNYTGRNGLGPSQIVWYDVDTYPARSALFFDVVKSVISESTLAMKFHPSYMSRQIEESVSAFEQSPTLVSESLSQPNPFHLWTAIYEAFSACLAGTTQSTDTNVQAMLEIFRDLDGFYARIIDRFMREIEEKSGTLLFKESAINNLSDQFDRLTAIWYVRQIIRLNFADRYLDPSQICPWSLSILTPRALQAGNKLTIKLREMEMYLEELRNLRCDWGRT